MALASDTYAAGRVKRMSSIENYRTGDCFSVNPCRVRGTGDAAEKVRVLGQKRVGLLEGGDPLEKTDAGFCGSFNPDRSRLWELGRRYCQRREQDGTRWQFVSSRIEN